MVVVVLLFAVVVPDRRHVSDGISRPDRSSICVGDARESAGVGGHLPSWGRSTLSCVTNDTRNPHTIRNQATVIRMIEAMQ